MLGDHNPGTHVGSDALEKSHVISTVRCSVRYAKALNSGVGAAWLHIFDAAALPANGTAPDRTPIPIAAGSVNGDVWGDRGTPFAVGCVLALSSTLATLTLIAGSEAWFDAEVVS